MERANHPILRAAQELNAIYSVGPDGGEQTWEQTAEKMGLPPMFFESMFEGVGHGLAAGMNPEQSINHVILASILVGMAVEKSNAVPDVVPEDLA